MDDLGIATEMRKTLIDDLHVIISNAASISYDDPLDLAVNTNLLGTLRMIDLANN